jgi:hypothetical protein
VRLRAIDASSRGVRAIGWKLEYTLKAFGVTTPIETTVYAFTNGLVVMRLFVGACAHSNSRRRTRSLPIAWRQGSGGPDEAARRPWAEAPSVAVDKATVGEAG